MIWAAGWNRNRGRNRSKGRNRSCGRCNGNYEFVLREERTNLKEPGIRRDNVPMKIRGVTSTAFLQTRVAEEKHVEGLAGKFIFPRSKIVNKTCAPEDLRVLREQNGIRYLVVKNRGSHAMN